MPWTGSLAWQVVLGALHCQNLFLIAIQRIWTEQIWMQDSPDLKFNKQTLLVGGYAATSKWWPEKNVTPYWTEIGCFTKATRTTWLISHSLGVYFCTSHLVGMPGRLLGLKKHIDEHMILGEFMWICMSLFFMIF